MKFKVGSDFHPVDEASLASMTIREIKSPRGFRDRLRHQLFVRGEVQAASELALDAPISGLINRYSSNYVDAGLCHNDGTPTPHFIATADPLNLTGNHIVYRSWPKDTEGEYANARTFAVMIEADFDAGESGLHDFSESLTFDGDAGPIYDAHVTRVGPPNLYLVAQQTPQRIIQSGYAVTYDAFYLAPSPIFLGLPHYKRPVIQYVTPKFQGQQYRYYVTKWTYFMLAGTAQTGSPTLP